jgi:hypothetical protein
VNYLTYNNPSSNEASWLPSEDIYHFLNKARTTLFRKSRGRKVYYKSAEDFCHTPEQLERIHSIIEYSLKLIGQNSNGRFGSSAQEQHRFFQSPSEQETFPIHLFLAIQEHKRKIVTAGNEVAGKEFGESKVHRSHLVLREWEDKHETYFKIAQEIVTENQLYAAGVFYMINFLLAAKDNAEHWGRDRLMNNLSHFANGTRYFEADGRKGGKKCGESRRNKKDKVYAFFCEAKIYEEAGPKVEAMLFEMKKILREKRISVPVETLRTRWIPEFAKRKKLSTN